MKVLITGSSGDIGSHLVRDFTGKRYVVRTLDQKEADYLSGLPYRRNVLVVF